MKPVDLPSGFTAKFPGVNTPFATAKYLPLFARVTWKLTRVSFALVEVDGATPIFKTTSAGTSTKGVAVLNLKSSSNKAPLT